MRSKDARAPTVIVANSVRNTPNDLAVLDAVCAQVTGLQISWAAILNIIVDDEDREEDKINWR